MATRVPLGPIFACAALLLVATAARVSAATTPPGVNLRWDHC